MDREGFIQYILFKKVLDKEIVDMSKDIKDFPLAYKIIIAINGQTVLINNIFNPKRYGEIDYAIGEIKRLCLVDRKDIKEDGYKFLNDLGSSAKLNFELEERRRFEDDPDYEIVIGIDLGTTNTVVSFMRQGQIEVIPLDNGSRLLPSVVSVNKNKKFDVGGVAKRQLLFNRDDTFFSIKRFMGRRSKDIDSKLFKNYPFKFVISGERLQVYSPKLKKKFDCEEISAQILKKVKLESEIFLKKEIKKCVITVPAHFDDNQLSATQRAAEIAGLTVLKTVREPTAAAFAYEIGKSDDSSNTLVCDLGGGTFDISLIKKIGSNIDSLSVTATKGLRELGGDDYTNLLTNAIEDAIKKEHDHADLDNLKEYIREQASTAKHALSIQEETFIYFPAIPSKDSTKKPFQYRFDLTREYFNEITKSKNDEIESLLKQFLKEKKVKNKKISKVVAVGGASRMPFYLDLLEKITGLKPQIDNNPDEIVSRGAALFAEYTSKPDASRLIIDVTPLSLGTSVQHEGVSDVYDILIPANSSIPIEIKKNYTTVYDNQESVLVDVYQGERTFSKDNIYLGDFVLDDLEKNSTKKPDIEITFRITIDGNLNVSAQDLKTKSQRSIEIKNSLKIPKEKVAKLKKYANEMLEIDNEKMQKLKKIINLSLIKKVFEKIDQPILSTSDELTVEEMNSILNNKEVSNAELDEISRLMRIIIREQDAFKIEDEDFTKDETQDDNHDLQEDDEII